MAEERLEEIRQARLAKREQLQRMNLPPYPAEAKRTHTQAQFQSDFQQLQDNSKPVTLVGRLTSLRVHGDITFADLRDESGTVQLQISRDQVPGDRYELLNTLDVGDFIQAAGEPTVTKRGVNSLQVTEFHPLTKSIRPLPSTWHGLKDHETRFRQREVDLLLNEEAHTTIKLRSQVLERLRRYFTERGYIEIDTPILQPTAGGAAARPFITHHNTLDTDLNLRIATELYLKRLLVAGYEKVFDMGHYFRNEGIDRQHNPEFTMLESQWAYADYEDYMDFTEDLINWLVQEIKGEDTITYANTTLSFAKPFKRVRYVELVSTHLNVDILEDKDPATYLAICQKEGIEPPTGHTYDKLVDELYKEKIRPTIIEPTLLYDYPAEMVPLAKASLTDPRIAEMFQLLVNGQELVKAYTEQNDPVAQRAMFEEQMKQRAGGDEEAHSIDEDYLRAMEQGMPPNAGFGLGVDRLITLLANAPSLRDTLPFPLLRPEKPENRNEKSENKQP